MPTASDLLTVPGRPTPIAPVMSPAMKNGKLTQLPDHEIELEPLHQSQMYCETSNMAPISSTMKGARLFLVSKYYSQSMPMAEPEAPLVDALDEETGGGWSAKVGRKIGLTHAPVDGVIKSVGKNSITLAAPNGELHHVDLNDHTPANRKTQVTDTSLVKPGDVVAAGQPIAHNNYVTPDGRLAMGKTLRVGFVAGPDGSTFEDGIAVSQSAANKLKSSHLYGFDVEAKRGVKTDKAGFISYFPNRYTNDQLAKFNADGHPKPGSIMNPGDPLLLAYAPRTLRAKDAALGSLHKVMRNSYQDLSQTWDKHVPGTVTDSIKTRNTLRVNVKADMPLREGDKVCQRFGAKGVISKIFDDDKMIHDADGKPMDILINPAAVIGRVNSGMIYEALLGKIAAKTGKQYVLPTFSQDSFRDFTENEIRKYGIPDKEDLFDPVSGRKVPGVLTGLQYFHKMEHISEDKMSGRGGGGEDDFTSADDQPGKGGKSGGKRLGNLQVMSLLSHRATNVIQDAQLNRGSSNPEMWSAIRAGRPIPQAKVPFIFNKFLATLNGAGIRTERKGDNFNILAMTDKDVKGMARHPIESPDTLDLKTGMPISGGLFDPAKFGGPNGMDFARIDLDEKIPNPLMEEPIRNLLGLTKDKFRQVLAGQEPLNGKKGAHAIGEALDNIDLDRMEQDARQVLRSGRKAARSGAVKKLGFITGLKKSGLSPSELMVQHVPVIPPAYRPISIIDGLATVSDPNYLYRDILHSREALRQNKQDLPDEELGDERLAIYDAVRASQGLGDPVHPELTEKGVKGFMKTLTGTGGPKSGQFLSKVVSHPMNTVGRGAAIPDANLNMDEIGIPEEMAWKMFAPFTIGRMARAGMNPVEATKHVTEQSPLARKFLEEEVKHRPVMMSRDPALHRYNIMGMNAVIRPGSSIAASPLIVKGYGLDFDGDQVNVHVPVSDAAIKDIREKMMPSKNLLAIKNKKIFYTPSQEMILGIHNASAPNLKKPVSIFNSKDEALAAYHGRALDMDSPIEVPD